MKTISIIGMGRWASCIAHILASKKEYKLTMWERGTIQESALYKTHKNQYLTLPKSIKFTHNLQEALTKPDLVIISILSQGLNELTTKIKQINGYNKLNYCIAMKGIEASTGRRLSQILIESGIPQSNIAVLAGPGHTQALTNGGATNMVLASYNAKLANTLAKTLSTKNICVTPSTDIIDTELCAACKNIYGIAAGIFHASKNYQHSIGSLMVASVKEMQNFLKLISANPNSASGLALLGDYQATMFDTFSKNLTYGKLVIEQHTLNPKSETNVDTVEGIQTSTAMLKLVNTFNKTYSTKIKMPLIEAINKIVTGKIPLTTAAETLFNTITTILKNA